MIFFNSLRSTKNYPQKTPLKGGVIFLLGQFIMLDSAPQKNNYFFAASFVDTWEHAGNGVVPATAERAFRTLLNELNT